MGILEYNYCLTLPMIENYNKIVSLRLILKIEACLMTRGHKDANELNRLINMLPIQYAPSICAKFLFSLLNIGTYIDNVHESFAQAMVAMISACPAVATIENKDGNLLIHALLAGIVTDLNVLKALISSHEKSLCRLNAAGLAPIHVLLASRRPSLSCLAHLIQVYPASARYNILLTSIDG